MSDSCVKCGCRYIIGPRYRANYGYLGERLFYECARCGFSWTAPTLDSEDRPLQLPAPRPPRES